MKKAARICSSILAVCLLLVGLLSACGVRSSPESITQEFFSAVKTGDMERGIECFTPSVQSQYKAMMALFGGATGFNIADIWGGLVGYSNSTDFKDTDFKISNTKEIDSTHTKVNVDIYEGEKKTSSTSVTCVKIDDEWYIES